MWFPVNFVKFPRTPILKENLLWLLLIITSNTNLKLNGSYA